ELKQVEEIARTIAIARFLELQYHWTEAELIREQNLRRVEHDRLDDLFHQLRNPLTALRTFGKLLLNAFYQKIRNISLLKIFLLKAIAFKNYYNNLRQNQSESLLLIHRCLCWKSVKILHLKVTFCYLVRKRH
ncbi:MAG: hypothetical protein ACRDBG_16420, partial [Waterburya sp.]